MQNNFISKTIKTFLTSLVISVLVFGSFYFLLSDNSSKSDEPNKTAKKDTNTKLVMEEDSSTLSKKEDKLDKTSIDIKKEVLGVNTQTPNTTQAQTGVMLAQISDTYAQPVATTPVDQLNQTPTTTTTTTTNTAVTTVPATTYNTTNTKTATGVPTTGNEGLYVLMAAFSLISGFLITNGKELAMKNFEK